MFKILNTNQNQDLLTRLLTIRWITDNVEDFLNPSWDKYRKDPFEFEDMSKAVDRILTAIKNKQRIVVFGDYDVDGVTSAFSVFYFIRNFLNYKDITIRLPSRLKDWYWIKAHHIEEIKNLWASLIITVDNGITSVKEVELANKLGIDVIITDHHKSTTDLPPALAIINPNVGWYPFKWLAGVGVAFKLCSALASKKLNKQQKNEFLDFFLPIVALGTIADIVPLIDENRLFVKKWLELLNAGKWPQALQNFISHLNIKSIDTFHISFMIAPRLNASWRMKDPYEALKTLLYGSSQKRVEHINTIENLNTQRKGLQDELIKKAEQLIDKKQAILVAVSNEFHEGIIWLVAGKLTEKYNKPSVVIAIDEQKWVGVASLRSPAYFSIIDLLKDSQHLLKRFGGHSQAWWFTIKIDKLEELINQIYAYGKQNIDPKLTKKVLMIDTKVFDGEMQQLQDVPQLAPFGEGNPQPVLLIEWVQLQDILVVGKNGNSHLKLIGNKENQNFPILFWKKWEMVDKFEKWEIIDIIGKIKNDSFNGGFMVEGIEVLKQIQD